MNNKFDLERFKAGECAETNRYEYYYLADLPDGSIAYKWKEINTGYWGAGSAAGEWLEANTTMKPRGEFIVVKKNWKGGMSFQKAEQERMQLGEDYITVKIVR